MLATLWILVLGFMNLAQPGLIWSHQVHRAAPVISRARPASVTATREGTPFDAEPERPLHVESLGISLGRLRWSLRTLPLARRAGDLSPLLACRPRVRPAASPRLRKRRGRRLSTREPPAG